MDNIQVSNPDCYDLALGVSAKRQFKNGSTWGQKTFYGVIAFGHWYLNGKEYSSALTGNNGEKIRERIDLGMFYNTGGVEIDISIDCDNGILKMVIVGNDVKEDKEVYIEGFNNPPNDEIQWTPHLVIGNQKQQFRICAISSEDYGKPLDIDW